VQCPAGEGCFSRVDPTACLKICSQQDRVVLETSADVAALAAQHCEVLEAPLVLSGPLLTSVVGLEQLRVTHGLLLEGATSLESLTGLAGLAEISGDIEVSHCDALKSLGALPNPHISGGGLNITYSMQLENLDGLQGIEALTGVTLASNLGLRSVRLPELVEIAGPLLLADNDGLSTLELPKLKTVGQAQLTSDDALEMLELPALTEAATWLVAGNAVLESISLDALSSIDSMTITGNASLRSIGSLGALMRIDSLIVAQNPRLPQCQVDAIDARLMACSPCTDNDDRVACGT
jgi:hypothetical protein